MLEPSFIPDLVISLAAAIGLLIVRAQIGPQPDGLAWRIRLLLLVTSLFYLVRATDWLVSLGALRTLTIATAAAVPFFSLLLTEGMLRRHAPKALKLAASAGLVVFSLLAIAIPITQSASFLSTFLGYQTLLFLACFWLLLMRDRASLSAPDNRLADRVLFAGPFILALFSTDYGMLGLPGLSGLAALIVAWVASTSEARVVNGTFIATVLGLLAVLSGLGALALGYLHSWSPHQIVETAAMFASFMLGFLVWLSSVALRRARARAALDRALARSESLPDYIKTMEAQGLTDGFVLLGPEDLRDFDRKLLIESLGVGGVISVKDLPMDRSNDTRADSQIRTLFERFARVILALKKAGYATLGNTWIADVNPASLAQKEKSGARKLHRLHLYRKSLK